MRNRHGPWLLTAAILLAGCAGSTSGPEGDLAVPPEPRPVTFEILYLGPTRPAGHGAGGATPAGVESERYRLRVLAAGLSRFRNEPAGNPLVSAGGVLTPGVPLEARDLTAFCEASGMDLLQPGPAEMLQGARFLLRAARGCKGLHSSNAAVCTDGACYPLPSTPLVTEREGTRLGVFGLISPALLTAPVDAAKREILVRDPAPAARQQCAALRESQGCDFVACLWSGSLASARGLARHVDGLDLILVADPDGVSARGSERVGDTRILPLEPNRAGKLRFLLTPGPRTRVQVVDQPLPIRVP